MTAVMAIITPAQLESDVLTLASPEDLRFGTETIALNRITSEMKARLSKKEVVNCCPCKAWIVLEVTQLVLEHRESVTHPLGVAEEDPKTT